jgi:hypothetical protein
MSDTPATPEQLVNQAAGLVMRFDNALRANADTRALVGEMRILVSQLRTAVSEAGWPADLSLECRGWIRQLDARITEAIRRHHWDMLSLCSRLVTQFSHATGYSREERLRGIDEQIAAVQSLEHLPDDVRGPMLDWFRRMADEVRARDEGA